MAYVKIHVRLSTYYVCESIQHRCSEINVYCRGLVGYICYHRMSQLKVSVQEPVTCRRLHSTQREKRLNIHA
jgi:hypothetical protein